MQPVSFVQALSLTIHMWTPQIVMWVVCLGIIGILLVQRRKYEVLVFTVSLTLTMTAVVLTKVVFAVPRPLQALVEVQSYAFPSGHAASGMFLAFMCTWLYTVRSHRRPLHAVVFGSTVFALALLLGLSRIGIGVHTPLQVIGGFLIGIGIPLCVILLFSYFNKSTT